MRYIRKEINRNDSYGFTVSSRTKPDSKLRRQIEAEINEAMSSFERGENARHSVAVVPSATPDIPDPEPLEFVESDKRQYLVFAILETGEAFVDLAESDIEQTRSAISEMISGMIAGFRSKPKIALVVLRDCTVEILEGKGSSAGSWGPQTKKSSRWNVGTQRGENWKKY